MKNKPVKLNNTLCGSRPVLRLIVGKKLLMRHRDREYVKQYLTTFVKVTQDHFDKFSVRFAKYISVFWEITLKQIKRHM